MIGVVILNYMVWEDTISCVESVRATCTLPYRIYVVDNASPNESGERLEETYLGAVDVVFIGNQENRGYSAGNNIGLSAAFRDGCEMVVIANSDVVFHEGSIEELSRFFECCPEAGILGPKVLNCNGDVTRSVICMQTGLREKYLIRTALRWCAPRSTLDRYYGMDRDWSRPFEVFSVSGCCLAINKKAAASVTPFDENTFLYEEELILGIHAASKRVRTYYCPEAVVTHKHATSSKHIGPFSMIHAVRSEIYYCVRYLECGRLKIVPLYAIRTLSYLYRMPRDRAYRACLRAYLSTTLRCLTSETGLG